jgi:hypothetical protein
VIICQLLPVVEKKPGNVLEKRKTSNDRFITSSNAVTIYNSQRTYLRNRHLIPLPLCFLPPNSLKFLVDGEKIAKGERERDRRLLDSARSPVPATAGAAAASPSSGRPFRPPSRLVPAQIRRDPVEKPGGWWRGGEGMGVGTDPNGVAAAGAAGEEEGVKEEKAAAVSCSICLEAVVAAGGERSTARLQCGHEFHLGKVRWVRDLAMCCWCATTLPILGANRGFGCGGPENMLWVVIILLIRRKSNRFAAL